MLKITSELTDLPFNASTSGIVSVLVFGAGTDYALLLIARYREELRREPTRRVAMRRAWMCRSGHRGLECDRDLGVAHLAAGPDRSSRAIGVGGAIGIATALIFGLLVLPAALVVCPRGIFWPLVPKVDPQDAHRQDGRAWRRIGNHSTTALAGHPRIGVAAGRPEYWSADHELRAQSGRNLPDRCRVGRRVEDDLRIVPGRCGGPGRDHDQPGDAEAVAAQAMGRVPGVARSGPARRFLRSASSTS